LATSDRLVRVLAGPGAARFPVGSTQSAKTLDGWEIVLHRVCYEPAIGDCETAALANAIAHRRACVWSLRAGGTSRGQRLGPLGYQVRDVTMLPALRAV
jgi:hypothetical protein